jgi:hypothetical protein
LRGAACDRWNLRRPICDGVDGCGLNVEQPRDRREKIYLVRARGVKFPADESVWRRCIGRPREEGAEFWILYLDEGSADPGGRHLSAWALRRVSAVRRNAGPVPQVNNELHLARLMS